MPRLLASACRQVPQQLASADSELLKVLFGFSHAGSVGTATTDYSYQVFKTCRVQDFRAFVGCFAGLPRPSLGRVHAPAKAGARRLFAVWRSPGHFKEMWFSNFLVQVDPACRNLDFLIACPDNESRLGAAAQLLAIRPYRDARLGKRGQGATLRAPFPVGLVSPGCGRAGANPCFWPAQCILKPRLYVPK